MKKLWLMIDVLLCNICIKFNKFKFLISLHIFFKCCNRCKKEYGFDLSDYWVMVTIYKAGYKLEYDYYRKIKNYLLNKSYISYIDNDKNKFEIEYVNIDKNYYNKFVPIILSATVTLVINYLLYLITN